MSDIGSRWPKLNSAHEHLMSSEINEVIAREGGSGLLKVRKIMAVDLYRSDPSLRFSYDSDGKFVVMLDMGLEGLTCENPVDRG